MIEREPVPIDDPDPIIAPKVDPPLEERDRLEAPPMDLPEDPDAPRRMDLGSATPSRNDLD